MLIPTELYFKKYKYIYKHKLISKHKNNKKLIQIKVQIN